MITERRKNRRAVTATSNLRFTYEKAPGYAYAWQVKDSLGILKFEVERTESYAENICNGLNICHTLGIMPALLPNWGSNDQK